MSQSLDLSIVSSMYCSAPYLKEFYERVTTVARKLTTQYEIVFVNDGSPDDSLEIAVALSKSDPHVVVVDLSRNFGHHRAMMTGLAHAQGKKVLLIDCDLEEAPELLEQFDAKMQETQADVVYGVQIQRADSFVRKIPARIFYKTFNALSNVTIPENLVTMRLMSQDYVTALLLHQEREITISGLWVITGFKQVALPIEKLCKGTSTYTFRHRLARFIDDITAFSNRPLVIVFYLGIFVMLAAGLAIGYLVFRRLFLSIGVSGWASLIVSIWMLGGITIFSIGLVGIYVSKVFIETKQRPYTIIRKIYRS